MDTRIIGNGYATPQMSQMIPTAGGAAAQAYSAATYQSGNAAERNSAKVPQNGNNRTSQSSGARNASNANARVASGMSARGAQNGNAWIDADGNAGMPVDTETLEENGVLVTLSEDAEDEKTDAEKELESLQKMVERMKESRKKNEKKDKAKKRLNYTYRRVSGKISSAKTVNQASRAVSSANTNLSMLRRKSASGKYDDSELEIAIIHAKKMVRVAKKKLKNVKNEQQMTTQDNRTVSVRETKAQKILVRRKRDEVEEEIEELKEELEKIRKQYKISNRRDEDMELLDADMEYLRKKVALMKAGKGDMAVANAMSNEQAMREVFGSAMGNVIASQASAEQMAAAVEAASSGTEAPASAAPLTM